MYGSGKKTLGLRKCAPNSVKDTGPSGTYRCTKYDLLCGKPKCGSPNNKNNVWQLYLRQFRKNNPDIKGRGEVFRRAGIQYKLSGLSAMKGILTEEELYEKLHKKKDTHVEKN